MTHRHRRAWLIAGAAFLHGLPAHAQAADPACAGGECTYRVTPRQLLAKAEQLVLSRDFAAVAPLLEAMEKAPELDLQRRFLVGYVAVETGDTETAIANFRSILNEDPGQTRVRLELARALLIQGKEAAADHHFRLAQQDQDLPEEVARTIRSARGVLRTRRTWNFSFDVGIAPDTNINNATSAESIDVRWGQSTVPLELDDEARQRSGVGQTAGFSGGARVKLGYDMSLLIDADGQLTNYGGTRYDDFWGQIAVGPEFKLGEGETFSLQAVGQQRWYGGDVATRQYGLKAAYQKLLDEGQRIGVQIDARRTESGFNPAYDGWQVGAYATYERVVRRAMIASATAYVRRDLLEADAYSSTSYGIDLGIGGELPMGINAGLSGGVGRASFDAPLLLFSDEERRDWLFNARAYVGLRSVKLLGFSPSATYTYGRIATNYELYRNDRHRIRFNLARYF